ncbi:sensor histidine kinase [Pararobbsia silviterrae]|uniref:Sensor histidine kinase n=1 Tax=Pararobbsia silviterrae TaxID=1792498 RepID=A0A494Y6R5_9BURK|nr:histidine kinase [Pararobbsia silviterrae]RKP58409.1 sensor histidine kinase [Pararobbsia silviterrae]
MNDVFPTPKPMWRRLSWFWAAFWLLMLAVSVQESLWMGHLQVWRPLVDTGSSAIAATVLAIVQIRRADRLSRLLNQPIRWFLRLWAWMPLQFVAFVTGMYALRLAVYALAGQRYRHGPWPAVLTYEVTSFLLYFTLFSGIHFGLRSYRAWVDERLVAERQVSLARQIQLAQLTQQLQPHFLFNALNTISSLIHSDPDSADRLLTRLATLLRATTDASQRPEQPLADELALLRAYAAIMTQRFADRVRITWDIDPAAHDCHVPTLALQPLLENCFHHVVERRMAPTHIAIRGTCREGRLDIEIEDDGDLQQVPERRGVGLGNLAQRLQSLHGGEARLDLRVRAGGGLIVGVSLPCAH